MAEDTETGSEKEQTPEQGQAKDTDEFKSEESKQRVLADLARERDERQKLAARLKEYEDRDKTEQQKLEERAAAAEKAAAESGVAALRLEVALDKAPEGMSLPQIRKLARRLSGSNREELESDADDLFAEFESRTDGTPPSRRPKERLRPGASSDGDPEETPEQLAEAVRAKRGY